MSIDTERNTPEEMASLANNTEKVLITIDGGPEDARYMGEVIFYVPNDGSGLLDLLCVKLNGHILPTTNDAEVKLMRLCTELMNGISEVAEDD